MNGVMLFFASHLKVSTLTKRSALDSDAHYFTSLTRERGLLVRGGQRFYPLLDHSSSVTTVQIGLRHWFNICFSAIRLELSLFQVFRCIALRFVVI